MDFKNPKINIIHLEEIPSTNTYAKDLAKEKNITLVGFIRKNSGNIYHEGNVKLNEQSR